PTQPLPLDRSRRVALARQIELLAVGRRSKELQERLRLPGHLRAAIELLRTNDDDGLAALLHDALWTFRANAPEQFAEPRFRLVQLPGSRVAHRCRLIGLVKSVNSLVAARSAAESRRCGSKSLLAISFAASPDRMLLSLARVTPDRFRPSSA